VTAEASGAVLPVSGRYDFAERRRAKRSGREKGCWAYIPADELAKAGYDPGGDLPFYRTWGHSKGRVLIQLYRKKK
jgi:hypothetical protein